MLRIGSGVVGAALAWLVASLALPAAALAQKVDFAGQKITLAIATPAGGGYDLYGRLVGRYLGAYLPGHPTIVPQNMPGAGSLIAANWLYTVAPKDGTAIAIMPSATAFENLLGNASARFDARKFNWLISLNDYTAVAAAWHATPFLTAKDMLDKEFLVGASALGLRHDGLADGAQCVDRHQDQAGARLSRHRRHHARDGARRGAGRDR